MTYQDPDRLTKVTVNLTPRAISALNELTIITGSSKTEVINHALQVYQLVDEWTRQPGGLRIMHDDGTIVKVYLL
jgi:hypothetical protein